MIGLSHYLNFSGGPVCERHEFASIRKALALGAPPVTAKAIVVVLAIAVLGGLLWSVVINRDWLAKLFTPMGPRLSSHDFIFPVKGIEEFKNKWHVIGLVDGKEICGIIREYNVETHELLLERGRMVLPDGALAVEEAWFYVPSGDRIRYMRTIEESGHG